MVFVCFFNEGEGVAFYMASIEIRSSVINVPTLTFLYFFLLVCASTEKYLAYPRDRKHFDQ